MFSWFEKDVPMRTKFHVLLLTYTGTSAVSFGTIAFASTGHADAAIAIGSGALGLTVLIGVVSAKLVTTPYVKTVSRMEGLTSGDLTTEIVYTGYHDCVCRMTKAMSVFRDNARDVAAARAAQERIVSALGAGLGRLAKGDLSGRIDEALPADHDRLRQDYNAAVDELSGAMIAVTRSTTSIRTASSEISAASDDLSHRTEQQAASLEEAAASMDGIISVIDGIAFYTNLLALNAGVAAARAGDACRGFAVVASEVRALAYRSADAAKDVKTRIMASSEQVGNGVELVGETGKSPRRIIGRINEIGTLVPAIAASAEQQASGLQQVNTAVVVLDNVTQQNAAMVEQSTAAARSLAGEADELAWHVARFRIAAEGEHPVEPPVAIGHAPRRAAPTRIVAKRPQMRGALAGGAAGRRRLVQIPSRLRGADDGAPTRFTAIRPHNRRTHR